MRACWPTTSTSCWSPTSTISTATCGTRPVRGTTTSSAGMRPPRSGNAPRSSTSGDPTRPIPTATDEARSSMRDTRVFPRTGRRLAFGLAAICLAQFLALLDGLIVSVALPPLSADLGLTPAGAQWVLNAYTVPFAGLLLLGGRAADALGRRRGFAVGQLLLIVGSLVGGIADTSALVYLARVLQATGAALAMPAA